MAGGHCSEECRSRLLENMLKFLCGQYLYKKKKSNLVIDVLATHIQKDWSVLSSSERKQSSLFSSPCLNVYFIVRKRLQVTFWEQLDVFRWALVLWTYSPSPLAVSMLPGNIPSYCDLGFPGLQCASWSSLQSKSCVPPLIPGRCLETYFMTQRLILF